MGAGKSQAAIEYINNLPPGERVVYTAIYNDEAERIQKGCPDAKMYFPEHEEHSGKTKWPLIERAIKRGENVACTHQALPFFSPETLDFVAYGNYTLIIDESYDVLRPITAADRKAFFFLLDHECLNVDEDTGLVMFRSDFEEKSSDVLKSNIATLISHGNIYYVDGDLIFWTFPVGVLDAFSRIIVLSYMLDAQPMYYYLLHNKFQINNFGVHKFEDGHYEFCSPEDADGFPFNVRDKIEILQREKLNSIGDGRTDLSVGWCTRTVKIDDKKGVAQLGRNVWNVFKHIYKCKPTDFAWTCFSRYRSKFKKKGIITRYIPYNQRASNKYSNAHYLAYAVNVFNQPNCYNYFKARGLEMDMDRWALSVMIQWIWRSAIRNGEKIYIYLPSKRMRDLLEDWMDSLEDNSLEAGGEEIAV